MNSESQASAPVSEWNEFLRLHPGITGLDAFVIDVNGNTLGKRVPAADAAKVFTEGVQFSACALIADCRGLGHNVQGFGASDGDPGRHRAARAGQPLPRAVDAGAGRAGPLQHARHRSATPVLVRSPRHPRGHRRAMPRRRHTPRGRLRTGVLSRRSAARRRRPHRAGRRGAGRGSAAPRRQPVDGRDRVEFPVPERS